MFAYMLGKTKISKSQLSGYLVPVSSDCDISSFTEFMPFCLRLYYFSNFKDFNKMTQAWSLASAWVVCIELILLISRVNFSYASKSTKDFDGRSHCPIHGFIERYYIGAGNDKRQRFVSLVIHHDPIVPDFNRWFKAQVSGEFPQQDPYTYIEDNKSLARLPWPIEIIYVITYCSKKIHHYEAAL